MKRKLIWIIVSSLMALSLVLASCTTEVEEEEEEEIVVEEEEEEEEGPPTGEGDWWDELGEPEYGGTITLQESALMASFDPYNWTGGVNTGWVWHDTLLMNDWKVDREIFDFSTTWTPDQYWQGCLAESWEWPEPQTCIVHLRQGVYWQDKPPVNGREFTTDDLVYHYDRMMGTGSGFTEVNPFLAGWIGGLQKVTATDKYTAVFEFAAPNPLANSWSMCEVMTQWFEAPEAVEAGITDWTDAVGTGPWMVTDYVSGSSITYSRNPNYWGYDERHPENQIPYADKLKITCIPDVATELAALRTGKVDMLRRLDWEQEASLERTNPELKQAKNWAADWCIHLRCDREPFTDIRVRTALQMAIDLQNIAETHFGGTVDGIPCGAIAPQYEGLCFPYDEWPQELKDEYSYNPQGAKELLAEAGYPNGFETNCLVASSGADIELLQIIQAYFADIGVDMEIRMLDLATSQAFARAGKHDQMYMPHQGGSAAIPPLIAIVVRATYGTNNMTYHGDLNYDAIVEQFNNAATVDEARQVIRDADRYYIEHHWCVETYNTVTYNIWQPYLKGYLGENIGWGWGARAARFWIDQELKKSMGY